MRSLTVRKKIVLGALLIIIIGTALYMFASRTSGHDIILDGRTLSVSIADTELSRAQGLSGRTGLAENEGMLFVFGEDGEYGFWMKDMHYSLDILWLNDKKEVLYVVHNATPASYPHVFTPTRESRYVIEVPAGDATEVKPGDFATF